MFELPEALGGREVDELSGLQGEICSAKHHFRQDHGEFGSKNTSNDQLK
jgi:hypothetical protein